MNYIVIDLEFNQNFDFRTGTKAPSNPLMPLEIIQIGAVKLDGRRNFVDRFGTTVKPRLYRGLNPFVAKVTGLSKGTLRNSPTFVQAYRGLVKFIGKERATLCFWGNDDMRELLRNILFCKQSTRPLPLKYINVQSLASLHLELPAKQQVALETVVKALDIRADLPFHSAPNDAFYTAQIFRRTYDKEKINLITFDLASLKKHNAELAQLIINNEQLEKKIDDEKARD
ncbi:MAG: exonuclease domain-containing protein [Clostridiales bacterium]|nr:exonuclease domain-containing protein [Clostridiales bacterium]